MASDQTKPDKILLVANWESDVGYAWWLMENFWVTISLHFKQKGIQSVIVYPKVTHIPETIQAAAIEVCELDFNSRTLGSLLALRRFIKQHRIAFLYLTDWPAYSLRYLLLRLWGVKKIVIHDHTPGERTAPSGIKKILKSLVQRLPWITGDHFIAATNYVLRRFTDVACIPRAKCSVAQNGIIPIDLSNTDPDYAYQAFSIPRNRKIIVNAGRASYYKGIDFIIECVNELINNRHIDDIHFLYCGDGPEIDTFKNLVKEYHLQDHFTFGGKRSDMRNILPSCHIGINASHGEVGYSLAILEYMSAGLGVAVNNLASTSGSIYDGVTGLLYTDLDMVDACQTILRLTDDDYRSELGRHAARAVIDRFSLNGTNEALIASLNSVFSYQDKERL